jgi:hypothetical protein
MELKHSNIGPSRAKYWAYCAGSVSICRNVKKSTNDKAKEGNAAHELAAHYLLTNKWWPQEIPLSNGYIQTEEMRDYVKIYINDVINIIGYLPISCDYIESTISIFRVHINAFGTCDLWYFDTINKILYIWDFKYGWGLVDAYENYQLIMYAVGLLDSILKKDTRITSEITVCIRICQPRPHHSDGPIREWKITASELNPYIEHLQRQAQLVYEINPPLVTGAHCRYCDALVICPAAAQAGLNSIDVSLKYTDIELLNIGRHYQILKRAKEAICNQFEALETFAIQSIKNGELIPELEIQPSRGSITWQENNESIFSMGDLLNINLRQPEKPCTPLQAINKGIPEDIVKMYSKHVPGKLKLIEHNSRKAKEMMKNE